MTVLPDAFPETVSQEVREYIEHYVDRSNASSTHHDDEGDEEYFASLFTEDGVYDFMHREARGHQAIKELRHELFANIPHRDHRIVKVFSYGKDDMQLMALGEVEYVHHSGKPHWQLWTARYILSKTENGLKFKLVSVVANPDQQDGHHDSEQEHVRG